MLRIHCDFDAALNQDTFPLPNGDTGASEALRDGAKVILFQPGKFEVEAESRFDATTQRWFSNPDWSTIRHLPAKAGAARKTLTGVATVGGIFMLAIVVMFLASLIAMGVHTLYNGLLQNPPPTSDGFIPDRAFVIILVQSLVAVPIALPLATWYIGRQKGKQGGRKSRRDARK